MGWLAILILVLVALVAIAPKNAPRGRAPLSFPYAKQKRLFSPAERSFLGVLDQAVGRDYRILGKVRVADALKVSKGAAGKDWQAAFNKISAKHFDFLLCTPEDLAICAAIELDDASHRQNKRQARDHFLASACEAAGLPLIRIPAQRTYEPAKLRNAVLGALGEKLPIAAAPLTPTLPEVPSPLPLFRAKVEPVIDSLPSASTVESSPCPQCGSAMSIQTAEAGAMAGRPFWRCGSYPRCRGAAPLKS